jgi:hypothetical protein
VLVVVGWAFNVATAAEIGGWKMVTLFEQIAQLQRNRYVAHPRITAAIDYFTILKIREGTFKDDGEQQLLELEAYLGWDTRSRPAGN